jgi:hypothetical protein
MSDNTLGESMLQDKIKLQDTIIKMGVLKKRGEVL